MVLTASAGKVFGALLGFLAFLTVTLLIIHYWYVVLGVLGFCMLLACVPDRRQAKADRESDAANRARAYPTVTSID